MADKLRNDRNEKFIREIVTGKEVKRYNLNFDNLYLLYIPWEYDLEFDQGIKEYLLANKDILSNRPEVKDGRFNWWCLSRYGSKNAEYLFKSKIIYPRINNESNFFFDAVGNFSLSDNNFFISTDEKYLMPILNSKIVFYFLKSIASTLQGGYLDFRRPYMEIIPIKIPENQKPFIEKSDSMLILNKDLQVINRKFTTYFSGQYKIEKLTKKLENWHELTFAAFITEINKAIKTSGQVPLTKKDEFEWLDLFEENKNKAQTLKSEINKTDKEIDTMVYELYGLSEEEILIVEEK
ncbi:TaqI-like C-terminal specificity domain-containing protein [Flavobacterium gawalongense]|uniref:TaqI-like C-terminal specificity domain-containing protein n=1 Tax=Flavobacterium gawalongense TaxID=2594432 RepID=UPI00163DAF98|nr:TaqI-like C-terminal specificity domain-containing protein [Flavobacterium gawalongense]